MQDVQFITHDAFHQLECGDARAVTAVENGVKTGKLLRSANDDGFFFIGMLAVLFHYVETCDNAVGGVSEELSVAAENIRDTVVRTAR